MVTFEVSFRNGTFCLRRLVQGSVCDDSAARILGHEIFDRFTQCLCTFWSKMLFYVTSAGDRMVLEGRNVSLCGRCKKSGTLWKSWQAPYFVDVAKKLAGVLHSKDCVLRGRRRESAPWILYFVVEGLDSWERLRFWIFNLTILLRGQCSISYDFESWFRGRCSISEIYFRNMNPLRRSCVSIARHAAKDVFSDFQMQFSAEIVPIGSWYPDTVILHSGPTGSWCRDPGILSRSPLQEYYRLTAITASRRLPQSPLQENYRNHRFKNVTAITASRRLLLSPFQEKYCSHRFKKVTAGTISKMWP